MPDTELEGWYVEDADGNFMSWTMNRAELSEYIEKEKKLWAQKGYTYTLMSYQEFIAKKRSPDAKAQPRIVSSIIPVEIHLNDIPSQGLLVTVRRGEGFGGSIKWDAPENGTLIRDIRCNPDGEIGINIIVENSSDRWGYAGFNRTSLTWWRYQDEGISDSGEHCLQILKLHPLN